MKKSLFSLVGCPLNTLIKISIYKNMYKPVATIFITFCLRGRVSTEHSHEA